MSSLLICYAFLWHLRFFKIDMTIYLFTVEEKKNSNFIELILFQFYQFFENKILSERVTGKFQPLLSILKTFSYTSKKLKKWMTLITGLHILWQNCDF